MSDPNTDRERLADEAIGRDPDKASDGEPWAKTSSGNADSITDDDSDISDE